MIRFDARVSHMTGPLFDGGLTVATDAAIDEAQREVAQEGVNDAQAALGDVLQHPTGAYQSRITTERARDDYRVTDGGVIYGAWLAGTSSRNRTTRFKGYTHWRRAAQRLERRSGDIASRVVARRIGGL